MFLHVPTLAFATCADRDTPWHRLHPRARLLAALVLVFGIALIPNGVWPVLGLYAGVLLLLILLGQVNPGQIVRRLGVELAFVGVILLSILFSGKGTTLVTLGPLTIAKGSLVNFGSVLGRAVLSLLILNVLTLTTATPALLQALTELRCPRLLVNVLESMVRYIAVLADELATMRRAAQARSARSGTLLDWGTLGNILGTLFLRTYGRGERIHLAMQARGFTGTFPTTRSSAFGWGEWLVLAASAAVVVGAQYLVWGRG
ncbi:cobalt ECF transporter T component CbiQ [Anthocerotibacter panamensis]|uniref:cobalt ECF transporter T component CbiQ n=1 Tax=Anthocerotibacter panamensis TaxID=2857077 RepID=UPI001C405451|nr:cobalt ECF transporter T component CbiQ [Anthocerotibacter panamensis]